MTATHLIPDQPVNTMQAEAPSIKTADGWLICLAKRSRLGGAWFYDAQYFDSWYDAQDCYEHPPGEWQATAIHACKDGQPFAKLSAYKIGQLRAEG